MALTTLRHPPQNILDAMRLIGEWAAHHADEDASNTDGMTAIPDTCRVTFWALSGTKVWVDYKMERRAE